MRLPDVELSCDEEELTFTESIASRHLVSLPVHFTPRPQQEITQAPSHEVDTKPPAAYDWQIGAVPRQTPAPAPEPAAVGASVGGADAGVGGVPDAGPVPAAVPVPPPAQPEPPKGAWQRFLRWWRGY